MSIEKERAQALKRATVLTRVFSTEEGKVALDMLEREANYRGTCYSKGDPTHTTYLEGKRDLVVFIHEMMSATNRGEGND